MLNIAKLKSFFRPLYHIIIYLLHRKHIIVLIGNNGVVLNALLNDKVIDSLFIPGADKDNLDCYKAFFNKFKKFSVFFLLDNSDCKVRHDILPVLQTIVKTDPVEKFVQEYFDKYDIVAYYIYNVITQPNESWHALIVSTSFKPPLSKLIEYTLTSKLLKFGGVYFLALEFKVIIDRIIKNIENNKYANHLQILVLNLKENGIKLVVKHQSNIISVQTIEYPEDKSEEYIQGVIEQAVADCLIYLKSYLNNFKLEVCIIFAVENSLAKLLEQSRFDNHQVICSSNNKALDAFAQSPFSDEIILKLFTKSKNFLATNDYLKIIARISFSNSLIFKPLIAIIVVLTVVATVTKIRTLQNYRQLRAITEQNYDIKQQYYSLKQQYPYINNAANLVDLYTLEVLLRIPVPPPFDILEKFILTLDQKFDIDEINWQRLNLDNILVLSSQYLKMEILLKFKSDKLSIEEAEKSLSENIEKLHDVFKDMEINYVIFHEQIIDLYNHHVVIPLLLTITERKG